MQNDRKLTDVGGTPGGLGAFFLGLTLSIVGAYWLTQQVEVTSGVWTVYGYNSFGLSLVPFILGMVLLFSNGESMWGYGLLVVGILIILAGILLNLRIYFQPTSLFDTLMMIGMLSAGVGLIIKSLRPHMARQPSEKP